MIPCLVQPGLAGNVHHVAAVGGLPLNFRPTGLVSPWRTTRIWRSWRRPDSKSWRKEGAELAIASTVASDDDNHAEEGSRSRRTTTTMMAISGWELLLSDTISQRLVISCHRRYRHLNGAATTGGAVAPISSSRSSKSHRHCSSSSTCEFIISTFAVLDMSRRASPTSASWLPLRCPRQFDGGILPRIGADTCQGPRNNQLRPQETRLFQST